MSAPLPDTMRAAVYRAPRRLEVEQRRLPPLGPRDALVEVSHCGVCGTDLHLVMEGLGRADSVGGHEYSGRIAALGDAVEGWALGDRVAVDPNTPACGRCEYCQAGRPVLCQGRGRAGLDPYEGAFAQYARVDHRQLLRVPEDLDLRAAALMEPLAVALHAITLAALPDAGSALVMGAGPIGAFCVAALRATGAGRIGVVEPAAARREWAAELGADVCLAPEDVLEPASFFDVIEQPFDAVLECSGQPAAIQQGLTQLKRGGTLVLVGTGTATPQLDTIRMLLNELSVRGSYNYDPEGLAQALRLLGEGRVPVTQLAAAADVSLEGLQGAMQQLSRGEIAGKVLVRPG